MSIEMVEKPFAVHFVLRKGFVITVVEQVLLEVFPESFDRIRIGECASKTFSKIH